MKIVLASESIFRKRAMDLLGLPYETRPSLIDEKAQSRLGMMAKTALRTCLKQESR